MSVDLMKLREDLVKMRGIMKEYTLIFEASDGIDSEEQAELNKMQDKVDLIESKLHKLLGSNEIETSTPAIIAFENKWMNFIQALEGDILKYGLNVPQ